MINANGILIDRQNKTISHAGETHCFVVKGVRNPCYKRFNALVYLILAGGASREQVFWHLYANDADGGPLAGPSVVSVWLTQSKSLLDKLQLETRHTRIANVMFYEIVPIFQLYKKNWKILNRRWSVEGFGLR
jgi:hypothetical protein